MRKMNLAILPEQQARFDAMKAVRDEGGPGGFGPRRGHRAMAPGADAPRP